MCLEEFLGKKYKLVSNDNFDEYMKALDVHGVLRKVATKLYPVIILTRCGKDYTLTSTLPFKTIVVGFTPGVEFDQETPDGRDVKSTITINGCTLHEVQRDDAGKTTKLDRKFSKDQVEMVMTVDNITATRIYKIQEDPYY